ncbi:hypothetical protein Tco_0401179 [Tanacetum coccineum]
MRGYELTLIVSGNLIDGKSIIGERTASPRNLGYKDVTRRYLEALELKGGDGGTCKVLGWLLGDVMVMQGRCLRCLAGDTQGPQNLGEDTGNIDEPPVVNVDIKDWFKKPERPPTPDPHWNKGKSVKNKPTQKWLSDLAKEEKPSRTFDDLMSTPIDFNVFVMNCLQNSELTQDILVGPAYNILKGTCRSYVELDYNMEECYKELTNQLDWNNPKGDRYPFDLSKPLPQVMSGNRQIISVDYFFNNDLAYLQGESTDRTYMNSLTKRKVAKYDLPGIEDMALHIGVPKDKASTDMLPSGSPNMISDQQLYKFMEGDFPRLHLHDIEDMLILLIQNRLFKLKGDVIVHLATTLHKLGRNRLMCSYELYKFSDGTLISFHDTLKDMANNLEMGYTSIMPRRRGSSLDKKRSHIMIKDIDHQLLDRRLMRSLEKFVGDREYGEDL